MPEIKLRPDEARAHADDVKTTKEEVFDQLDSLRKRIEGLTDSFTGETQEAFIGRLDEWKSSSDELLVALEDLGTFLRNAADAIEDLDHSLAGQI